MIARRVCGVILSEGVDDLDLSANRADGNSSRTATTLEHQARFMETPIAFNYMLSAEGTAMLGFDAERVGQSGLGGFYGHSLWQLLERQLPHNQYPDEDGKRSGSARFHAIVPAGEPRRANGVGPPDDIEEAK